VRGGDSAHRAKKCAGVLASVKVSYSPSSPCSAKRSRHWDCRGACARLRAAPCEPLTAAPRTGPLFARAMGEGRLRRGLRAQSVGEDG